MRHHNSQAPADVRRPVRILFWLAVGLLAGWRMPAHAQWITQNNVLKAGWNAVYLHVDASHTNVNGLVNLLDPIEEVWMWSFDLPPGLSLATPPDPTPSSQWSKWTKLEGATNPLRLPGNVALLVKASAPTTWSVKGRAVPPRYRWTLTGLNFVGFPTASPTPNFENFLGADAQPLDWKSTAAAEIFRYQGGNLGATNPIQVSGILQRHATLGLVNRDQAYWIRTGEPTNQIYNHYFGPFQVTGSGSSDLRFGDSLGQSRLYLKNMSKSNLTVTLREVPSEATPLGVAPSALPLMVRGPLVTSNLTFSYISLTTTAGSAQWTLAPHGQPGSEAEVILGVDRSQMGTTPGALFAGVLRFTDNFGMTRVEIGASATSSSRAGLWVGNAVVDQVSQYLKQYVKATNATEFHTILNQKNLTVGINNPTGTNVLPWAVSPDGQVRYEWDTNSSLVLVFGTNVATGKFNTGSYLQKGDILTNLTSVTRPVPLRLIVHNNGTTTRLMQRAYLGRDITSNQVVAATQSPIAGDLANARRLSAVHLPTSDGNGPWILSGVMGEGGDLVTTVNLGNGDHASNPFLHTYHPDHDGIDNRDDTFQVRLSSGKESYDIRRVMTLSFTAPGNDFDSRTRGGTRLEGNYLENVTIRADTTVLREFNVLGLFSLTRITDTAGYAQ
jgi:hypothetical protein